MLILIEKICTFKLLSKDSGDHDYCWHWKLSGLGQLVGLRLSSCMLSIRSVTVPAILESRSVGSWRESLERQRKIEEFSRRHVRLMGWGHF
jgi:hypothetical protein